MTSLTSPYFGFNEPAEDEGTKQLYTISPVDSIADQEVISQLPPSVLKSLGDQAVGSGFNLLENKRDVDFQNGYIVYQLGNDQVEVWLE